MFGRKEGVAVLISILLIGFVFGFDDGSTSFSLNYWLLNFFKVLLIVSVSILLREMIMKIIASKRGCTSEYEIWNWKQWGFHEHQKWSIGIPVTAILAFLITLLSNGKVFFTAIGNNIIRADRSLRVGRKFTRLDWYSESLVFISGILTTAFMAVFFSFLDKFSWVDFSLIVSINIWLTLWSLLPLPSLNAGRLFMGSRAMYVFVLALVLVMFLIKDINIILNLILSLIAGGILVTIYYYFVEY